MLTGIKTRIQTNQFDQMLHFYCRVLGLHIVREWNDESDTGAILGLPDAGASGYLEIAAVPEASVPAEICLQFRTDSLAKVIDDLKDKYEHSKPEKKSWGSTYVYLTDPAGNRVIVFEGDA